MPSQTVLFLLALLSSLSFFYFLDKSKNPKTDVWLPILTGISLLSCMIFSTILSWKQEHPSIKTLAIAEAVPFSIGFAITLVQSVMKRSVTIATTLVLLSLSLSGCSNDPVNGVVVDHSVDSTSCRFAVMTNKIPQLTFTVARDDPNYALCAKVSEHAVVDLTKKNDRFYWVTGNKQLLLKN